MCASAVPPESAIATVQAAASAFNRVCMSCPSRADVRTHGPHRARSYSGGYLMSFSLAVGGTLWGMPEREGLWVPPEKTPREPEPPEPPAPRRFRVLDVVTRELLLGDGSVREMLSLL